MDKQNTNVFWLALAAMEAFRLKGGRHEPADYAIRVCESLIAETLGFKRRDVWTEEIQSEGLIDYGDYSRPLFEDDYKQQYKTLLERIRNEVK